MYELSSARADSRQNGQKAAQIGGTVRAMGGVFVLDAACRRQIWACAGAFLRAARESPDPSWDRDGRCGLEAHSAKIKEEQSFPLRCRKAERPVDIEAGVGACRGGNEIAATVIIAENGTEQTFWCQGKSRPPLTDIE